MHLLRSIECCKNYNPIGQVTVVMLGIPNFNGKCCEAYVIKFIKNSSTFSTYTLTDGYHDPRVIIMNSRLDVNEELLEFVTLLVEEWQQLNKR